VSKKIFSRTDDGSQHGIHVTGIYFIDWLPTLATQAFHISTLTTQHPLVHPG
jgi:hypothetical protein